MAALETGTEYFLLFLIFEVSISVNGWPEAHIIVSNIDQDNSAQHFPVAGAQLQRPLARPHLPGDEELATQASPS